MLQKLRVHTNHLLDIDEAHLALTFYVLANEATRVSYESVHGSLTLFVHNDTQATRKAQIELA